MWDSFKENTEPARVETFQQNGMNVSVETYPDGSMQCPQLLFLREKMGTLEHLVQYTDAK